MYVSFEYSFRNRHICLTSLAVHLKHTLKYPFAASNLSLLKRPVESLRMIDIMSNVALKMHTRGEGSRVSALD